MKKRKYSVAVVGATGLVGREMISILEQRSFPVSRLIPVASERSIDEIISYAGLDYAVAKLSPEIFNDVDVALFSAGSSVSHEFAPIAASKGAVVIDNTSAFRMDSDIPLVVPEVNPEDIADYKNKGIIANPNCSTIQMVVILSPINKLSKIKRVVVSTYQAVAGAGKAAIDELSMQVQALFNQREIQTGQFPHQIAFNCLPHIDAFDSDGYTKEERKMIDETKKIMHRSDLNVTATCVRVPVFCSHAESVNIELEQNLHIENLRTVLSKSKGITVLDETSSNTYPLPVDVTGTDDVYVGRIRQDHSVKYGFDMWIVADNLRKGAALNAVQIAEILIEKYIQS